MYQFVTFYWAGNINKFCEGENWEVWQKVDSFNFVIFEFRRWRNHKIGKMSITCIYIVRSSKILHMWYPQEKIVPCKVPVPSFKSADSSLVPYYRPVYLLHSAYLCKCYMYLTWPVIHLYLFCKVWILLSIQTFLQ